MSTRGSTQSLGTQCAALARRFHVVGATTPAARRNEAAATAKRQLTWLDLAKMIAKGIECGAMLHTEPMERPASFMQNDMEILKRLQKFREQARELSLSDKEWVTEYHGWLDGVRKAEGNNQGNVNLMLSTIARCPDEDPSCSRIRAHLQSEYQWAGPAKYTYDMVHNDVLAVTRRTDIVPTWLLMGEAPKGVLVPAATVEEDAEDVPGWMK